MLLTARFCPLLISLKELCTTETAQLFISINLLKRVYGETLSRIKLLEAAKYKKWLNLASARFWYSGASSFINLRVWAVRKSVIYGVMFSSDLCKKKTNLALFLPAPFCSVSPRLASFCLVLSRLISFLLVSSHPVPSRLVSFCLVSYCLITSHFILSSPVLSRLVSTRPVPCRLVLTRFVSSRLVAL